MGISISKIWNYDTDGVTIPVDPNNPLIKKITKAKEEMTGWDRVKLIFETDDLGEITPEMTRIRDGTFMGFFLGGMFGAFGRSKIAYSDFFRSNYHEAYETPLKAKSALQEKVTLGMMSGGFRVGWRVGAFTGIYLLTSTCIASYRNKIGVLDQVGAGGVAGFLYKFREGPKSMVAGTGVGTCLGLCAGLISIGLIKITGLEPEKANIWFYQNIEMRKERMQRINKLQRQQPGEEEDDKLMIFHESFMKPEMSLDVVPDSEERKTENKENALEENQNKVESLVKTVDIIAKSVDTTEKLDTIVKTVTSEKLQSAPS